MARMVFAIAIGLFLLLSILTVGTATAEDAVQKPLPSATGGSKPGLGNGPAVQQSLPSSAPAATTRSTGATNQDTTVKAMNSNEKAKVEVGGK